MTGSDNVVRPHRFRGPARTVRQPSPAELLHGIGADLEALAKGPHEHLALSLIRRIEAVADRLTGGGE